MRFFVQSFGCRTNQAEMQHWVGQLENRGYRLSRKPAECRFGIVNTCSLTQRAESKTLRFLRRHRKKNPRVPCVVTGCTVVGRIQELSRQYPGYRFVSNRQKNRLPEEVQAVFPTDDKVIHPTVYRSRYFLKIQDGCNFRCAYCIIPFLRGKSRSLERGELVGEACRALEMGYREIVITGINISSYGFDRFPRERLIHLLKDIDGIEGVKMIRLSSLDPRIINYTFIRQLREIESLARSFHISFQSGSNRILRDMKRAGKREDYLKLMGHFKEYFPGANFGTDIITGFSGETEKEFMETVDFVKSGGLNYLHIFPFSPRRNTTARNYPVLPSHLMTARSRYLRDMNRHLKLQFREGRRGCTEKAVVIREGTSYAHALTSSFLKVRFPGTGGLRKRMVRVKIRRVIDSEMCEGEWLGDCY